jgi:hypothetical protein
MAQVSYIAVTKLIELLRSASASGPIFARIADGELRFGSDPLIPTHSVDFSAEAIRSLAQSNPPAQRNVVSPTAEPPFRTKLPRKGGKYVLDIRGEHTEYPSLKEMLSGGLRKLETCRPGMLDKLAAVKPRSKRIVAHEPQGLFDQQSLVKDHAERLMDGWWFGTNNSADETNTWLKRACELAGLTWGKDVQTSL